MENGTTDYRKLSANLRRISAGSFALALGAMQIAPAYAAVHNSVTASGTAPGNVAVSATATADVFMATPAPAITVAKTASFAVPSTDDLNGNGLADPGDKITYVYTVTNSGNVTVKNVGIADTHDGVGTAPAIVVPTSVTTDAGSMPAGTLNDSSDLTNTTDALWGTLGPGDVIKFQSTYTVVTGDITGAGGGTGTGLSGNAEPDGYLDNSATASASYTSGTTTTNVASTSRANMQLNVNNHITITKTPNLTTNVNAGDTVTYTYVVANDGNTPVSSIDLHDTHKLVLDAITPTFVSFNVGSTSTNTGNHIDVLQPGDSATFTATYIVTQSDVDSLQ